MKNLSTLPGANPDMRRANAGLVVAASAMLLISFVGTATNIAVPVLQDEFTESPLSTISWVVSGFNVVQVTFMLLGGRLADRLGRKSVFLTGMLLFALGAGLSGFAPSILLVVAARAVQAVGAALILPSSLAAVLPQFPRERHATVVSMWSSMGVFGSAAAPTIAAGVLGVSSWRAVFLLAVPVALIAFVAGMFVLLPDESRKPERRLDWVGATAGTFALAALVLAIVQGRVWGWTDPRILAAVAGAVVAAGVFVASSLHHDEPLIDFGLFRIGSFTVVTLATSLLALSTTATWFLYPLFMREIWDYSILQVGLAMTPGPLILVAVAPFSGRFADRNGYRGLLTLGTILATVGTAWMAVFLAPGRPYVYAFLPGTVLIGFGMSFMLGPGNSAALRDVPDAQLGAANAVYNTCRLLGGSLGVAMAASLLGNVEGAHPLSSFRLSWWVVVVLMALAVPILWFAYPRTDDTINERS